MPTPAYIVLHMCKVISPHNRGGKITTDIRVVSPPVAQLMPPSCDAFQGAA